QRDVVGCRLPDHLTIRTHTSASTAAARAEGAADGIGELQRLWVEREIRASTLKEPIARSKTDIDVRTGKSAACRIERGTRHARLRVRRPRNGARAEPHAVQRRQ